MDTYKRHPASPVCIPMPETLVHATADTPPPKSRHGMARRNIVVSVDDADYFRRFRNALYELYHPVDDNESFMLDQIICHRWFLLHSDSAEAAAMRTAVREAEREPLATSDDDPSDVSRTESERDDRATAAMCCDHQVQLITRYRVRHERAHERWSNLLVQHQLHRGNAARLAKVPYHSYIRNRKAYYDKPPQPIDPPDDPYTARDVPADFAKQPRAVAADVSIDTHDFPAALINQTRKITIDFPNDVHDVQDIHADPSTDAKKIAEDSVVAPNIATQPRDDSADLPAAALDAATDDTAIERHTAPDKMSDAMCDVPETTADIEVNPLEHTLKPNAAAEPEPALHPEPTTESQPAPQPAPLTINHRDRCLLTTAYPATTCSSKMQITAPYPAQPIAPSGPRANYSARLPVASCRPSHRANYGADVHPADPHGPNRRPGRTHRTSHEFPNKCRDWISHRHRAPA